MKSPNIPGSTAGFWMLLALFLLRRLQMIVSTSDADLRRGLLDVPEQVETGNIATLTKTDLVVKGELKKSTPITLDNSTVQPVQRFKVILLTEDPTIRRLDVREEPRADPQWAQAKDQLAGRPSSPTTCRSC